MRKPPHAREMRGRFGMTVQSEPRQVFDLGELRLGRNLRSKLRIVDSLPDGRFLAIQSEEEDESCDALS